MRATRVLYLVGIIAAGYVVYLTAQQAGSDVRIDSDDIGGVVTSAKGPEAGAWVIAETKDLPTKFAKIVVTDDRGRYVLPDLPKGNYTIWARGSRFLSGPLLVFPAESSREERISRCRTEGQRHFSKHEEPGRMVGDGEDR